MPPPPGLSLDITVDETCDDFAAIDQVISSEGTWKEDGVTVNSRGIYVGGETDSLPTDLGKGNTPHIVLADGTRIDINELVTVRTVGRGAGGRVDEVTHPPTGLRFAVKTISLEANEIMRRALLTELKTMYSRGDGVIGFYGAFTQEGSIVIVMDFMDGGSVAQVMSKVGGCVPENVIAQIARGSLVGLNFLHSKRLFHRDIKPGNLLLNSDGKVVVADFGVSSEVGPQEVASTFVGTVTYMSPERIEGKPYGTAGDVWSLGLSLLECSLGEFPYEHLKEDGAMDFFSLMDGVVNGDVPKANGSAIFQDFLDKMLAKDAAERWNCAKLLEHPFIVAAGTDVSDVAAYVSKGKLS